MSNTPFDLENQDAYLRWRDQKLAAAPRRIEDIMVEVQDPRALIEHERLALLDRCRIANFAIYVGPDLGEDRSVPRLLGAQLGLVRMDHNPGADEDDLTALRVLSGGHRQSDFIPYTDRPLHWHTDGYYNPPEREIRALLLHCVRPASLGGSNACIDHEMAYLLLREESPEYVRVLSAPDAMTIPAYFQGGQEVRPKVAGPVFSVTTEGHLHMRYTARAKNIVWREDCAEAIATLKKILEITSYVLRATLSAGQGLVGNNFLHDRSGFTDDLASPRLIYRARYYDRVI